MLQINSPDPMALRPKKRDEMTTDEPARAGYQTPNLGAQFVFLYNSQWQLGSKAILDVPASLDPQAAGQTTLLERARRLTRLITSPTSVRGSGRATIQEVWTAPGLRSTERSRPVLAPTVRTAPNRVLHAGEYYCCCAHAHPEAPEGCGAS